MGVVWGWGPGATAPPPHSEGAPPPPPLDRGGYCTGCDYGTATRLHPPSPSEQCRRKGQLGILLLGVGVARGGEPGSPRSAINFFVRAEREALSSEVGLWRPRKLTFHGFLAIILCAGLSQKVISRRKSRSINNLRFSVIAFLTFFFCRFPVFFSQTGKMSDSERKSKND